MYRLTATTKDDTILTTEFDDPDRAEAERDWIDRLMRRGVDDPCICWRVLGGDIWVLNPADITLLRHYKAAEQVVAS